jgi:hypothetical protein
MYRHCHAWHKERQTSACGVCNGRALIYNEASAACCARRTSARLIEMAAWTQSACTSLENKTRTLTRQAQRRRRTGSAVCRAVSANSICRCRARSGDEMCARACVTCSAGRSGGEHIGTACAACAISDLERCSAQRADSARRTRCAMGRTGCTE